MIKIDKMLQKINNRNYIIEVKIKKFYKKKCIEIF